MAFRDVELDYVKSGGAVRSQDREINPTPSPPSAPRHRGRKHDGEANEKANSGTDERDVRALARLGKRSVMQRRFGFISTLGFSCSIMITWEACLILFTTGLTNGGSAGLIYEYLFVWVGTTAVFTTMGELASMAPTAGGQYHWMVMLSPPWCRNFLSYIMGWLNICGWQAVLATGGYLAGTMIVAVIQLNYDSYVPKQWHGTLLFWAVIVLAVFINTVTSKILPKIEATILILHLIGFFAILFPLINLAPQKASPHDVFTEFLNGGAWPTQGISFLVGTVGSVLAMFGCDSAVHMAEEVRNAPMVVPWSMVTTTFINGVLGFGMTIAVLFVTVDINAALDSPTGLLGYPYMQVFYDATGSKAGASTMIAIVIIMDTFATIAFLATASRIVWAFARDRGLPGWKMLSKVLPNSTVPLYSIVVTSLIACLLGIINIGSAAAFNDIISLTVSSTYASYILTEGMLLWRRIRGDVKGRTDYHRHTGEANELIWGPFHLPGVIGILVNAFAVLFGIIIFVFSFFPVVTPVVASKMNYSVLMTGAVVLFAVFYYLVKARRIYTGPIVEVSPVAPGHHLGSDHVGSFS